MTNSYETVNDVLVKLFKEIMGIEEKALITSEYKDISVNDMHVIEAIGIHEKKNMSAVAKALSVTVGTVTIAINNLVKKGYVKRVRSEKTGGSSWCPFPRKASGRITITGCSTTGWYLPFWTD